MKTKKAPFSLSGNNLLVFLSALMLVIVFISSCSVRNKTSGTQKANQQTPAPPSPPPPPEPYAVVEQMPEFPGGDVTLMRFIAQNTNYPKEAKEKGKMGRVIVRMVVKEDGNVSDVKVMQGVDPLLDAEAVRVVSSLPTFTPGKQGGVAVPVYYTIPITFALSEGGLQRQSKFEVTGNDTIYTWTSEMPSFPRGTEAFVKFRSENLKFDQQLKDLGLEGFVLVNMIIEKDGKMINIRVGRGASPAFDAEALRVTKLMPAWEPGKEKGKPVRFKYTIPYEFLSSSKLPPDYKEGDPYVVVEEMPIFPGGDSALLSYISKNTKYPESAKIDGIQGRVIVRFCITESGGIDLVSVLKGVSTELDEESIRVVKTLPAFKPGKQGGKPVPVWYMVPITFALAPKSGEGEVAPPTPPPGYDEIPSFKGGEVAMYKFINSKIVYPASAKEKNISGNVDLMFCINPNGTIGDVKIVKSADPALSEEAIRVIKMLPNWEPGKLEGVPVEVCYPITITFTLK